MTVPDLGANHFTFTGENTHIVYDTQTDGPIVIGENASGGVLQYQGVEGNYTFRGKQIEVESTLAFGILITVVLKPNSDTGELSFTIVLPIITNNSGEILHFQTLGIKTATRGFIMSDGPSATYSVFPLLATAEMVVAPQ